MHFYFCVVEINKFCLYTGGCWRIPLLYQVHFTMTQIVRLSNTTANVSIGETDVLHIFKLAIIDTFWNSELHAYEIKGQTGRWIVFENLVVFFLNFILIESSQILTCMFV